MSPRDEAAAAYVVHCLERADVPTLIRTGYLRRETADLFKPPRGWNVFQYYATRKMIVPGDPVEFLARYLVSDPTVGESPEYVAQKVVELVKLCPRCEPARAANMIRRRLDEIKRAWCDATPLVQKVLPEDSAT